MEITSVCRQRCCNSILGWHGCQGGGAESLNPWFWFSLWLETIHPQDTFLSLCEGWEKWKAGHVWLWEILSPEYQLQISKSTWIIKTVEQTRLGTWSRMHVGIKLLSLTRCQVPRSSQPHKIHLRICHPARPYKPISPLLLSGLLRFCQGVFLSYFSKSSKVSLVCSVGFLLKPKVGKSYEHKNQ